MKKILFIINSYPSTFSANVLCDEKVIKELQKRSNLEIHCLCYKQHKDDAGFEIINGVHVHRISDHAMINHVTALEKPKEITSFIIRRFQRLQLRLKQCFFIPIYPIYEPVRCFTMKKAAILLCKQYNYDLIITEYNGLDTLMTGLHLKREFPRIKWIPIFWDSLAGGFLAKYLPRKYTYERKRKLEEKILTYCDKTIMMGSHKESTNKRWDGTGLLSKIEYLDIPYLVRPEVGGEGCELSTDKINFVFAGSFSFRDPEMIINIIKASRHNDISVWIYTADIYHDKLKALVGRDNRFNVCSYLSHEKLINTMVKADFFLNIGVANPNAISGKIFEYMAFGKPIISTYFTDDEACLQYLRKYPLSLCIDERISVMQNSKLLDEFIEQNLDRKITFEEVERLYPENAPESYADLICEVLT